MLNRYLACLRFSVTEKANVMIDILRKVPLIKNKIKDRYTSEEKKKFKISALVFSYLFAVTRIFLYVLFFMYIPMKIFSNTMEAGSTGFSTENCFVYFSLVLSCCAGSILHSNLFDVNESSYVRLKIMRINPSVYFRTAYLSRTLRETVGFMLAFCVLGLNPFKAFYLVVIILVSRYFGDAFNILVFKVTGKRFADIKSAPVAVMLIALFMAYFLTYLRGYVPDAYGLVFKTMLFFPIMILGVIFAYYVWINDNFDKIVTKIYTAENYLVEDEKEQEDWIADERKEGKNYAGKVHKGNLFLIDMFFKRNRKMFVHETVVKITVIAAAFALATGVIHLGNAEVIKKVVSYSMSVLIFAVFCLCESTRCFKELFRQCDRFILRFNPDSEKIANGFLHTLLHLLKINLVPVGALSASYLFIGLMLSDGEVMKNIFYICLGIIFLGILCTVLNLLLYYVIQPYDSQGNCVRRVYFVTYAVLYVICYGCLFIKADNLSVLLAICLVTAIVTAISVSIVYKIGKSTFRIKK